MRSINLNTQRCRFVAVWLFPRRSELRVFCAIIDAFCMFTALLDRLHVAVLRFPGDFRRQEKRKYLRNRERRRRRERRSELRSYRRACAPRRNSRGRKRGFKFRLIPRRRISNLRSPLGNLLVTPFVNGRMGRMREGERTSVTRQRSIS